MRNFMSLFFLLSAVVLFAAEPTMSPVATPAQKGVRERKVSDWIGGAKASISIQSKDLEYVGNPNTLNRCDRVVFSLDIRKFIYDGKVNEAYLEYQNNPMGVLESNDIALEVLESGRSTIRPEDIIASDTVSVCQYAFSKGESKYLKIDVTELVNKALSIGDGYITFRLRNITTETLGNSKSAPEGIHVPKGNVRLLIKKKALR